MNIDIGVILNVVLMMFAVLIMGYAARKLNWVTDTTSKQISLLLARVAQPMLIISSQLKVEYSAENLKNGLIVFAVGTVFHGIMCLLAYFAAKWMKEENIRKISEFCMIFANCGFVGYPVLEALIGPIGVFYASFYVLSFTLYTWTYGLVILGRGGRSDIKINPKNLILNFGTVSSFIGIGLYVSRIKLPSFLLDSFSSVGSVCTPLSVFMCGILLARLPFKRIFSRPQAYYVAAMRLLVFPIILTVIAKFAGELFGLPEQIIYICAILASMPSAAIAAMFTEMYDIEQEYAALIVGLTTALCVITVPAVVFATGFILSL